MKIPPSVLRRRIGFWQTQGLLRETQPDIYVLVDESAGSGIEDMVTTDIAEDDESESAMASASDQREEELQVTSTHFLVFLPEFMSSMLRCSGRISLVC